jgi:hypothetical protein
MTAPRLPGRRFSPNLTAMTAVTATHARRMVLGLGAMVAAVASCRTQDPCGAPSAACGGDPTGAWDIVLGCRDPAYQPPPPLTYYGQPDTTARQPPPEMTSSDWCSYLVYDPNVGITKFLFPYDTLFLSGGKVNYRSDGTFSVLLATQGHGHVDLSASCLNRFGALPSCDELTAQLTTFAATEPAYQDIMCVDDGAAGCNCTYSLQFEPSGGALSGRWTTDGTGVMTHFAGNFQLPSQVDYCVDSSGATPTLTLWGHDHTDIWNQAGIRQLSLVPAPPDVDGGSSDSSD